MVYDKEYIKRRCEVDPQTGCWIWNGGKDDDGYGYANKDAGFKRVHRLAYFIWFSHPGELHVCHSCDNPPCCNPDHLFLGTLQDNTQDSVSKGRRSTTNLPLPIGVKNSQAKLTESDVIAIRTSTEHAKHAAISYGITRQMIYYIRSRKNWKHLP